jgi:ABC-type multidrug transport system permease subunit
MKMRGFIGLTKRNLLVFFKDRSAVFFSLLTPVIVLALYQLFLKGTYTDSMNNVIRQTPGLSGMIAESDVDMLVNLVMLTGIVGSALITVSFNCLRMVVEDREDRKDYDIRATPVRRWQIALSYFVSAALSSMLLTGMILTAGLLILRMQGELYMGAADILKAFGITILGSVSATALFMIVVLFFRSSAAGSAFSGILSAAAGFMIGAYIPISDFSFAVQTACNLFPVSQVTILLRNILMRGMLQKIDTSLHGVDGGMFTESFRKLFSFRAYLFGTWLDMKPMLAYVTGAALACILIQAVIYSRTGTDHPQWSLRSASLRRAGERCSEEIVNREQ